LQSGNGEHPLQPQADGLEALRDALVKERRLRKAAEIKLARLRQQHISDVEKAVQVARDEGRAEAFRAAGLRVAAAEFRAVAVGKLADPAAALEVLDLSRFVGDGGGVDLASLTAMVNKLAAAMCTAGPTGGGLLAPTTEIGSRCLFMPDTCPGQPIRGPSCLFRAWSQD
jgi:hypothetical protein